MTSNLSSMTDAVGRLLAADGGTEHDGDLPDDFEASLSDDIWLGAIAIIIADHTGDLASAIGEVDANRGAALTARSLGFEPWEVAQYALGKR